MPSQADAFGQALDKLIEQATRALTLEITANLVEACPIKTGHAKANFVPALGEAGYDQEDFTGTAQASGIAAVTAWKLGDGPLSISNNVPYIGRLIAGSSSQAPPGWDLVAIDTAVATIEEEYSELSISVDASGLMSARGAFAASNLASAYSPFGDE